MNMAQRIFLVAVVFHLALCSSSPVLANDDLPKAGGLETSLNDWPWWRGPTRDGIAPADQHPPLEWDEEKNVVWKSPIPGRGHGSPAVVGSRVFLATADDENEIQSVVCFDRDSGQRLWKTDVHKGGFASEERQPNSKSSHASPSVACDGKRVFINFRNQGAVYTTALDLSGEQIWQTRITDYKIHQGYGSSPALYGPLVIVSADTKIGGSIQGLDRTTGDVVWQQQRPELPNYPSPIILTIDGCDQVILTGGELVVSYDPLTGEKNWEVDGATTECVTSTVTDGKHIWTSGGYPENHIAAMRADGSGEIVWKNSTRMYVPSMLVHKQHLYAVTDAGVAICYETETGKVAWKHRLGSSFTASPILASGNIYVTSDDGTTFVFAADPQKFRRIAENEIAGDVRATPVICGSRIYLRIAKHDQGQRQEMLYCLGVVSSAADR